MSPPEAVAAQPVHHSSKTMSKGIESWQDDRVRNNEISEMEIADRLGGKDMYIDGEKDTDWYHWVGSIYVKPLRFENRSGTYVIVLKTDPHAELGKHRQRGEVRAYTIRGKWGYHEYDWVGKPGDYVTEVPGTIHTLYMGEQSEVHFTVMGSIEFYNDDNTLREVMDGFSFWRMYEEHCKKIGKEPNTGLWY
jgi:2,4'-dihydroxyacetophenone dioxygenase